MEQLTDEKTAILDFERQWWKYAGAKEHAIREAFDCWSTRYYQLVNAIIDKPAALAYDAMLVRRLRRLRSTRARNACATSAVTSPCELSRRFGSVGSSAGMTV